MSYCDIDDVYMVGVHGSTEYNDNSTPTEDQVNYMIAKIAREIDSTLFSAGVTVPVDETTSPQAYALLTDLNAMGAAAEAEKVTWNQINAIDPSDGYTPGVIASDYTKKLKMYAQYPIKLIDAVLSSKHQNLYTAEDDFMYSPLQNIYEYSHNEDKAEESLKPFFRSDDEW